MSIYQVVKIGEDVLRKKAKAVPQITENVSRLLDDMYETMLTSEGVGLAAPQIGVSKRIVVIDIGEGRIDLINPVIKKRDGTETDYEGCLSVPGVQGKVERSAHVVVEAMNGKGETFLIEGEGLLARALQHEIDHLNGILFVDKMLD